MLSPTLTFHSPPLGMRADQALCEPTQEALLTQWPASQDLWIFAYASLIWRPEFEVKEQHLTKVQGWHRALKMWSRLNRGTPECPGLVFACCRAAVAKAWFSEHRHLM